MGRYNVLSTKKISPSLIDLANQNGIEIVEKEFISVQPIVSEDKAEEINTFLAIGSKPVVFTSSNAVDAVLSNLKGKKINREIYCLSGKTSDSISGYPYLGNIIDKAEDANKLARKIIDTGEKEVIFFCGDKRRDELPDLLRANSIIVYEVTVYRTVVIPFVTKDNWDAILFFSPSAVSSFFSVNTLSSQTVCFAIGHTTANTIARYTNNRIIVSPAPSQEKLLEAVDHYFKNTNANERIKE
jgi:uroporphyrinogen-III synthase